jgi:hypothetical protein
MMSKTELIELMKEWGGLGGFQNTEGITIQPEDLEEVAEVVLKENPTITADDLWVTDFVRVWRLLFQRGVTL